MDTICITFNCLTSLHPASYSLVENRSNIVDHQGGSFNELMLIHHLKALRHTKAGLEQLPTCTKLQVASRVELASRSCKVPTPLEFRLCGKQDLLPTGRQDSSCPSAWHCLRWLREDRRSQETSLHTKATDG